MRKIIGHLKEHSGIWTFGIFIVAAAGGIYQFTETLVSAQITPVKVRVDAEVKRLDAADQNTNSSINGLKKHMNERFDELKKDIRLNRERISLLDQTINRFDEKLDRKIELLDQKISRLDEKMDRKITLLDQKLDKKFDLILLRLPPLKK